MHSRQEIFGTFHNLKFISALVGDLDWFALPQEFDVVGSFKDNFRSVVLVLQLSDPGYGIRKFIVVVKLIFLNKGHFLDQSQDGLHDIVGNQRFFVSAFVFVAQTVRVNDLHLFDEG